MTDNLSPTEVFCYECHEAQGSPCRTPSGKLAAQPHKDRAADAEAITRHLRYMAKVERARELLAEGLDNARDLKAGTITATEYGRRSDLNERAWAELPESVRTAAQAAVYA